MELLKTKLPKDEVQSVKEEQDRLKVGFIETAEEVCGQKMGGEDTRTDRIKEAIRRKNNAWRKWFNDRLMTERRNEKIRQRK
jgi:hypothetical protein